MKKIVAITGLMVTLLAVDSGEFIPGPLREYNLSPVVRQVKPAVFRVMHLAPGSLETLVGGGSGSIVTPEGYGYTNWHVTTSAKAVVVTMDDYTECPAKVIGTNIKVDFALLKIECVGRTEPYPYIRLGDSNDVQKNEISFAIGSPGDTSMVIGSPWNPFPRLKEFQLINTVTAGIIRDVTVPWQVLGADESDYGKELSALFITSATINHGNSGGPSFNGRGEQIGINSWGWTGFESDNEIMPINDAHKSADDILRYGRVVYPWAGIYVYWTPEERSGAISIGGGGMREVGSNTRERLYNDLVHLFLGNAEEILDKLKSPVKVRGVFPGSPAAERGLARDDLIYAINGEKVKDALEFTRKIRNMNVGDSVELYIKRGEIFKLMKFTLAEQPQFPSGAGGTA
ncbi:MAG: S1C family serine protease [bacterium]